MFIDLSVAVIYAEHLQNHTLKYKVQRQVFFEFANRNLHPVQNDFELFFHLVLQQIQTQGLLCRLYLVFSVFHYNL